MGCSMRDIILGLWFFSFTTLNAEWNFWGRGGSTNLNPVLNEEKLEHSLRALQHTGNRLPCGLKGTDIVLPTWA